jgi:hypothetical protein
MKLPLFTSAVLLLWVFSGCFQQIAVSSLGGVMDNGFIVLNEEQDLELAETAIASDLKLLETILRSDPDNAHYLLLATAGYSSYAMGFAEDDSADRARFFYRRAHEFGLRVLARNSRFRDALTGPPEAFQAALESFSRDDVGAVFWTAVAWGSAISLDLTNPDALAGLPRVEAMMKFVLEKDSSYFYGGAHFFLGALSGSRPKILGGDSDLSRRHFEACLAINGGKFLMTYVYYARSYAVQTQNREFFLECLAKVDSASLDILPAARLSNAIAKKKAKLLRSKIDELF